MTFMFEGLEGIQFQEIKDISKGNNSTEKVYAPIYIEGIV